MVRSAGGVGGEESGDGEGTGRRAWGGGGWAVAVGEGEVGECEEKGKDEEVHAW